MDATDFQIRGKELVDYITTYLRGVRERPVNPSVRPGYLRPLLPAGPPQQGEPWERIFEDVERLIMPGIVHWQSPHMHGYYPGLNSYPSLLGDMLANAINSIGFTWASSPASTELELVMTDWLATMLSLPDTFRHDHPEGRGGGVIQTTVSESNLLALLAARTRALARLRGDACVDVGQDALLNARLVAYTSDQAHSSVLKASLVSLVRLRSLSTDLEFSLRGETLRRAVEEDRAQGLVPFFVSVTLGTTGLCAFDNLAELGPICRQEGLWLHVDAAYAGTAFLCPELRDPLRGVEFADSFVVNPSKWMMVNLDSAVFWVADKFSLQKTFSVEPLYLQHAHSNSVTDLMRWQIPLSCRFRALKIWFVLRSFGVGGLQEHVRRGVQLARFFENLVREDPRFEVPVKRHLGLVVFRLRGPNELTNELLVRLNASGQLFVVPAMAGDKLIIRFTITSQFTTETDLLQDWSLVSQAALGLLQGPTPESGVWLSVTDRSSSPMEGSTSQSLPSSPQGDEDEQSDECADATAIDPSELAIGTPAEASFQMQAIVVEALIKDDGEYSNGEEEGKENGQEESASLDNFILGHHGEVTTPRERKGRHQFHSHHCSPSCSLPGVTCFYCRLVNRELAQL
ncbi:aromatic-L-amino-acid decarboxylase-like [Petromyzon marinus]|uniref:Histidine decarboxylase n=1 Tax=Petromyzon marinus TaxID=7757 RepID=A0AAJ7SUF3_PETMA|nr:histidine decarboxylase-like [Petromyzon marinus]